MESDFLSPRGAKTARAAFVTGPGFENLRMGKEDGKESCGSRAKPKMDPSQGQSRRQRQQLQQRHKLDVYNEVLRRVKEAGRPEALRPSFEDGLWNHFNRLPARYAMDVNVERAEDVLMHQHLLEVAQDPSKRPAFSVRLVQVAPCFDVNPTDSSDSSVAGEGVHSTSTHFTGHSVRPLPSFGPSSNLESLALEASRHPVRDGDSCANAFRLISRPMHEITFSTDDRPKILSWLTSLLSGLGLDIQEAHAFSTNDGYSLDVFVVDGWDREETEELTDSLRKEIENLENQTWSKSPSWAPQKENTQSPEVAILDHIRIPTDEKDVWEINFHQLIFGNKVASGTYGDLYRGTYCSQDVAIKVLKPDHVSADMQREFAQEVYIMRKVRHKNVVQFIGASTRPPSLCIVTEFMLGGSLYDYLHKQKGIFNLPSLLRVTIDISKGMNYLHQNNIIHRDLKTANLLMDENKVVKVADFGVARVKTQSGVMTAETGTYRWMAPEVIEHKPYDHKADVFSFGVVLWELITAKVPYEYLTPLQAAVGVVQKGLRPTIPPNTHPKLAELLERCWQHNPVHRPDFSEILEILWRIYKEVETENPHKKSGGFLSSLRRGH